MAETNKSKPATEPKPAVEDQAGYSNERLAKMAKGTKVRVFDVDEAGKQKLDDSGRKIVVEREVTAADIFSHRVAGNQVVIVTVDGQKISVAA